MLVIGHRGASSDHPENTITAFRAAFDQGADGIELDLRLSSDGHVVVFHDDHLARLCGVSGSIENLLLQDIRNLTVKKTEKIPTLEEVLVEFHDQILNLELKKSERPQALVENVLKVIFKIRPSGQLLFSSFDERILEELNRHDPMRKLGGLGVLVESRNLNALPETLKTLNPQTWNVPKQILKAPWAQRWEGVLVPKLWIWTCDEPDEWKAVSQSKLPFEAIISNKPGVLRKFLNQTKN